MKEIIISGAAFRPLITFGRNCYISTDGDDSRIEPGGGGILLQVLTHISDDPPSAARAPWSDGKMQSQLPNSPNPSRVRPLRRAPPLSWRAHPRASLTSSLASQLPDGLSAEQLRRSLEGIPSTIQGAQLRPLPVRACAPARLRSHSAGLSPCLSVASRPLLRSQFIFRAPFDRELSLNHAPNLLAVRAAGMRSPLGEPVRSECVAGMDMLNDMFQRQVRCRSARIRPRYRPLLPPLPCRPGL